MTVICWSEQAMLSLTSGDDGDVMKQYWTLSVPHGFFLPSTPCFFFFTPPLFFSGRVFLVFIG